MNIQKEVYKDIPSYEGLYQISNIGNVKSLERLSNIRGGGKRLVKERILKIIINKHGYCYFNLSKNCKLKHVFSHQLVAMVFLNHKPNGMVDIIDHIDNDKLNNNVNNLQITTPRHNTSKDRKGYSSKHIGVCWNKKVNKWSSNIWIVNKLKNLGLFDNELDAAEAYQAALNKL